MVLIIGTEGRRLVGIESRKLIEESGRNAVSRLEVRLQEISALAVSAGRTAISLPKNADSVKSFLPGIIDYQGDLEVSGGGYWPEPEAFSEGVVRRAFFWSREADGALRYIDDYNREGEPGYHSEEWYFPTKLIPPDTVYWSRSYIDPHSRQPMVTCSAPLRDEDRFEGVFTIDLRLEGLEEFMESIRRRTGGYVLLLDRNNTFITFPRGFSELREKALSPHDQAADRRVAYRDVSDFAAAVPDFAPAAAAAARMNQTILELASEGKRVPADPADSMAAATVSVEEAALIEAATVDPLGEGPAAGGGIFGEPIELPTDPFIGEPALLYLFHVPGAYWKLAIVKPEREATMVADHIAGLLLLHLTAMVILAVGLFSWWLNRGVLRRIVRTTADVVETRRLVAERRFADLPSALPLPDGEDELAELAKVMRGLSQELKTTYEALEGQSRAFERFVPKQFLQFLGRGTVEEVQLGDQVLSEMAILFADVRGFTSLSEKMTPKENFDFINMLLQRVGPAVRDCGGFIDKYIGDAIMALFPGGAANAIDAGVAIQELLRDFNETRLRSGLPPVHMGVGIHSGLLMLGTIGEEQRMEGTVISDAVNLASRIEGLTSLYGCPLLVSGAALEQVGAARSVSQRPIAMVKVKGKTESVSIHEILDAESSEQRSLKEQTRGDFIEGTRALEGSALDEAVARFDRVLAVNPNDRAAQVLREFAVDREDHGQASGGLRKAGLQDRTS